jgi:hypothetical protein
MSVVALDTSDRRDVIPDGPGQSWGLDVRAEDLTITLELVDMSVERAGYISGGAMSTNREAVFAGGENGKAVILEFLAHCFDLFLGGCVLLELVIGEPVMKGGGGWIVQRVHYLIESILILQLELDGDVDSGGGIDRAQIAGFASGVGNVVGLGNPLRDGGGSGD